MNRAGGAGAPFEIMPDVTSDMAGSAADARRTWRRDVMPSDVDEALRSLWCEVARSAPGVTRALMSNLIIYSHTADHGPGDTEIEEVSRHHPCRVLRIEHDPSAVNREPTTAVLIHDIDRGGGRLGIEEIVVRVAAVTEGLASLVRRFVLGDLPTGLWWTASRRPQGPLLEALKAVARQLVYDSRDWPDPAGAARDMLQLRSEARWLDLADLAWQRVQPFQRAFAQAVDLSSCRTGLGRVRALRFVTPPADLSSMRLTLGWLIGQLGWTPVARQTGQSGAETITCDTTDGTVEISVRTIDDSGTCALTVETEEAGERPAIRIERTVEEIAVTYSIEAPPFSLAAPPRSRASLVAIELQALTIDGRFLVALDGLKELESL